MNIFIELSSDIKKLGMNICQDETIWKKTSLEIPKDASHGDVSTNIAMIAASVLKTNPRKLAEEFKLEFSKIEYVEKVEIAGPGFLNFFIKTEKWQSYISKILDGKSDFWDVNVGNEKKVNVEYVSANPTGPMHIGHARGAVYGDVLANILKKCGYDVTKEYYINDAGSQINTLIESSYLRYKEAVTGEEIDVPEGLYPGDYLKNIGANLAIEYGKFLLDLSAEEIDKKLRKIVIDSMMDLIREDLAGLGVHHDVFFSEQTLHDSNKIEESISVLKNKDLIYEGTLPPPKGKLPDDWQEEEQILFKSTNYGDDQDRAVQKKDGSWTYLAADFAYAQDKIGRGFDNLVYILGADHGGYVKRIKAVIDALSDGQVTSDIKISQLVNFVKDGKPVKMSKRSGNFQTVKDVINEVDKDIIRFIMLTRRSDMILDFDFDKVKEQSKDNPVFYVQYAHVRCSSILAKAEEEMKNAYNNYSNKKYDLSLINTDEEMALLKIISAWPRFLKLAAIAREPHKIAYYLIEVATKLHSIWHMGKENENYRFTIEGKDDLTSARLALAASAKAVIKEGLSVMGIGALDKM